MRANEGLKGGKYCLGGINCRGLQVLPDSESPHFYWVFRNGTAFADG